MPVFDFKNASNSSTFECTYTTFNSDNNKATKEHPILVLDNEQRKWENNSVGMFSNPYKKTAFEFQMEDANILSNILRVDAYRRRICGIPHPGNSIQQQSEALIRGWLSSVYDRKTA